MSRIDLAEELRNNSYPGRGIVLGASAGGESAAAAYFNLKHAIFVDVPDGIIDTIRWYNRIALMIEGVNVAVVICYVCNFQLARGILLIVEAGLCAGLMPVFKKEAKKWYR